MQAEQARFLLNFYLPLIKNEIATNIRVLSAIPEEQREYKPDDKARSAISLAWHIAAVDHWFLESIAKGEFGMDAEPPAGDRTVADIVAWYEEQMPVGLAKLEALSDEELLRELNFFGIETKPAVFFLAYLTAHTIHHRGQLSAYLRPMGGKVPSIYGGSADEPMEM